jgi:hypothetical protein
MSKNKVKRCKAPTIDGRLCRRKARRGERFCSLHAPVTDIKTAVRTTESDSWRLYNERQRDRKTI